MAKRTVKNFSPDQWKLIFRELNSRGAKYGLPAHRVDSLVLASWNLRQFGRISLTTKDRPREPEAFRFIASVLMHFDLTAIQELKDHLASIELLHRFLPEYDLVMSDVTGNDERLGFFSKFERVRRTSVAAEIDMPMVQLRTTIQKNWQEFAKALARYGKDVRDKKTTRMELPAFLGFARAPYCVSFEAGWRDSPLYCLAYNAHIYYGESHEDRTNEFLALLDWLFRRWSDADTVHSPNFIVFGDMNTEVVGKHDRRLPKLREHIRQRAETSKRRALSRARRSRDSELVQLIENQQVCFPFIDGYDGKPPPKIGSNLARKQRYDQIFLLMRSTGKNAAKIDEFGVVDLPELVRIALREQELTPREEKARIRQQISDHLPIWIRLKLPDPLEACE